MTEARAPRRLALEDGKLMPQGDNLHLELKTRPNGRAEGGEQGDEQRGHAAADRTSLGPQPLPQQSVPGLWQRQEA